MANENSIKGAVTLADGNPLSHCRVVAFDRDLRSREFLGEANTDKNGRYEIGYSEAGPAGDLGTADIFIEVFTIETEKDPVLLAVSDTLFNAPANAVINVTVLAEAFPPLSEYERLARNLQPLHEGISPSAFEENSEHRDITFLKGETGWDESKLLRYALGHRISARSPLPPQFWYALLGIEVLLEGAAESLEARAAVILKHLPRFPEAAVRERMEVAFARNEIERDFKSQLADWLNVYVDFMLDHIEQGMEKAPLKQVLEISGIDGEKQKIAVVAFLKNDAENADWTDTLREKGFSEQEVRELKTTFTLSELTMGNLGVVRDLKEQLGDRDLSAFAKLDLQSWRDLVREHDNDFSIPGLPEELAGLTSDLPEQTAAERISENFRQAFATVAFTADMVKSRDDDEPIPFSEKVTNFLIDNDNFDLLRSRIDDLQIGASLKEELKGVQRVFKVAGDFRITSKLLAGGTHSAQQIYAMGEGQFIARYSGTGIDASALKTVYSRAVNTHAAVISLVGELKAMENAQSISALNAGGNVTELFPNWKTLFGAADICECEHCTSVYSPGAYFADILMFLKHRNAVVGNVKDLLFSRRPDLGYLELSCDNANTELPYIDVVCEVLEEAVAPSIIFTLVAAPVEGTVSAAIRAEFTAHSISIATDAVINVVRKSDTAPVDAFTLRDGRHSFKIGLDGKVSELRQTRGKADELAAIPQYVNALAYTKLKSAVYPMSLPADFINKDLKPSLPFDLFSEEMRAYLRKHGVERWELMQTFKGNAPPNDPTPTDIAAEYFGISIDKIQTGPDERRIILAAAATLNEQRVFWGEPSAASVNDLTGKLSNVRVFLDKTGIGYNDLLKLLDLSFTNPAGNMAIVHEDSSCDLVKKHISNLDLDALDRIHRFLRLWRKLGDWTLWELNLAIMHPLIGREILDNLFLVQLHSFVRLKNELELPVEDVAALFAQFFPFYIGGISIESKFVEPFHDREPSFYEKLFFNKKKTNPLDPDFALAAITAIATPKSLLDNKLVVIAGLGIKEADLDRFITLEGLTGPHTLLIGNLSKIYRHATLARAMKMTAQDYLSWLVVSQTDLSAVFASPERALEWWRTTPGGRGLADIKVDELNYVLRADFTAKAAPVEKKVASFLTQLRKDLKSIKNEYDPRQYEALDNPDLLAEVLRPLLQKTGRGDTEIDSIVAIFKNDLRQEIKIPGLSARPSFPPGSGADFDITTHILSFVGVMSDAEKLVLEALSANPDYVAAIGEMHRVPPLLVKFILPFIAEAPLSPFPATVDFNTLPKELADKISYDGERAVLRFNGVMTALEKGVLASLATANAPYQTAIDTLFNAPGAVIATDPGIWRLPAQIPPAETDAVLIFKEAIGVLLGYFAKTLSDTLVIQQFTENLAIAPDLAKLVLETRFLALFADPLILTFTDKHFVDSQNALLRTDSFFTPLFDRYYWLHRLAWLLLKLDISFTEMDWLFHYDYHPGDGRDILNFQTLPVNSVGPRASYGRFLNLYDLFALQNDHSTEALTVFDVVGKLNGTGSYTEADFAADMQLLHDEWQVADVLKLASSLDLTFRQDYVFVESLERVIDALGYIRKLNGSAESVVKLVNPTVGIVESKSLKEMLRPAYSDEQWFELSKDVQNFLRDMKRDSLVAYLLTQPAPSGNPTSKWQNANDLYAYYLLDVQMGDCMITSRLVQASGSVQLFVQRCFMGLEPGVLIDTRSDEADLNWLQWEWMSKYRVWEVGRKIFLYPENWIEPQLRKDKTPFFKDLENELQQNELNKDTVETAFLNYIDKLDTVAQLEIAGIYYEEAKNTFHVFGRTALADPHIYYYRKFDENRGSWSAWTNVDVDIASDYLVPTVINDRLYIFWPIFTEEPVQKQSFDVPTGGGNETTETASGTLKVQMAVSEFRNNNKWGSKKVSRDYFRTAEYRGILNKGYYTFRPVDLIEEEGRFLIQCETVRLTQEIQGVVPYLNVCFEVFGCKGIPEKTFRAPVSVTEIINPVDSQPFFMKPVENICRSRDFFALQKTPAAPALNDLKSRGNALIDTPSTDVILKTTPGLFTVTRTLEPSFIDRMFWDNPFFRFSNSFGRMLEGLYSPFFYADKTRTFLVKPARVSPGNEIGSIRYYPEIKKEALEVRKILNDKAEGIIAGYSPGDLAALANNMVGFLVSQGYNSDLVPADPADVVRLYFRLVANFQIAVMTVYQYPLKRYHFKNHYHPFPCLFAKQVYNFGIEGFMKREIQLINTELGVKYYPKLNTRKFDFSSVYNPTGLVLDRRVDINPAKDYKYYPMEVVDFSAEGSYSQYNWELFYHAPLMIASQLGQNQRFAEAREWFHYIFNPLDPTVTKDSSGNPTPQKFWMTKPFFAMQEEDYKNQRIDTILNMLSSTRSGDLETTDLEKQVKYWRNDPFEPHVVALTRPVAYQKTVIRKYLDNLIAWGDYLFAQDSLESINEATQLYIQAAELLGEPPSKVSPQFRPKLLSFNELEAKFDAFSNAAVNLENLVPAFSGVEDTKAPVAPPLPVWLYFCIPQNDVLLGYYDLVADRLYKIRHCMNIEGVVVKRSLFEPPIDPRALVNAIAGGASLGSALADLNAPTPLYRFNVTLQKANDLCNDVKALGGALLSALEKKDGEELTLLRQSHELRVLDAVREIKENQLEDAKITLEGLRKNRAVTDFKRTYYEKRINENLKPGEIIALSLNTASLALDSSIAVGYVLAGGLKAIPNFIAGASGFGGSPYATIDIGGKQFGDAAEIAVKTISALSHAFDKGASLANTVASNLRRKEEWEFQRTTAVKELENIDKQIAGAELKIKIAEKELKNHDLQIENARAVDEFMHSKYTSEELYQWMVTQISQVYFQSYQLAYNLAKRAEKCYQFEIGTQKTYLQFGYWDSLKKGLLSGEKLQYGLRRLESAYMEQNNREFELSKHISLALTHPVQLLELKETGKCVIDLPEELFDFDYQGHYFRRIRSVSLSIPCIAGPYTTVSASLRLLGNEVRINSSLTGGYPKTDDSDLRFRTNPVGVKAVATSSAQNDSGVFELNFKDERYLPFEGAGAASRWSIELTGDKALRQFDYNTISDVILNLKYTAREDVGAFKNEAVNHLKQIIAQAAENSPLPLMRLFDVKHEFPNEYHAFKEGAAGAELKLVLNKDRFPFFAAGAKKLRIKNILVLGRFDTLADPVDITVEITNPTPPTLHLTNTGSKFGEEIKYALVDMSWLSAPLEVGAGHDEWKIKTLDDTKRAVMEDFYIVVTYDYNY